MKRRKFNQLLVSSKFALSFLPLSMFIPERNEMELIHLLGKTTSHLVTYEQHQLEKQTLKTFLKMKEEAKKEGIKLEIVSAFRSFNRQQEIFEKKFKQFIKESNSNLEAVQKITTYSSIPGTSRHHWGTDLDLIDANVELPEKDILDKKHFLKNGAFSKMYQWMQKNAHDYGFVEAYPDNHSSRKGYFFEPWHYSFLPTSRKYLNDYVKHQLIFQVQKENIAGLNEFSTDFFEQYQEEFILGIHQNLRPKSL